MAAEIPDCKGGGGGGGAHLFMVNVMCELYTYTLH